MAISTNNLVPLDFETFKENLKNYLKNDSQSIFKDVDFESSNISVMLDVLAYNTFHNSFYLNMLASEMFLDTAQLDSSVASHAKMLNYVPRSFRSAKAVVNIDIVPTTSDVESILIPKGASFTGRSGSRVFTFTTNKNIVVYETDGVFTGVNVELFEGRFLSEIFTFKPSSRFVISNPNVDTTSLTVVVSEAGQTPVEYTRADSFIGISSTDPIYFIQPAENGQYEILFGDGTFGKQPTSGATVIIEYRISSGELPNGAASFDSDGPLGGFTNVTVTVLSSAVGGAAAETSDQIRFRAPLTYSTQQRAVTTSDYKTLVQNEFPDISDIGVYGGEDMSPPRFGYVVLAMVSESFDAVTDARKQDVLNFIRTKCPVTVTPIAVDPEFSFIAINTLVRYDPTLTSKSAADLELAVLSSIKSYTTSNVNGFGRTLYYSKLLAAIDGADESCVSNDTTLNLYRLLNPSPAISYSATIDFANALLDGPTLSMPHAAAESTTVYSTFFTYNGQRCMFEDDGQGHLCVVTISGENHAIVNGDAGTVDYTTGRVVISPINITGYEGNGIRLYATTTAKDIQSIRNSVLVIKDGDINITMSSIRG